MIEFILYVIIFILVYLFYLFFVVGRKNKLKKYSESVEVRYLTSVYKVDLSKIEPKKLAKILGLGNSFIITLTVFLVSFFESYIVKFSLGFVILIVLELSVYHIIGTFLKKRGN